MQLGQLQKIEPELIQLGYQIIAISPDRPEKLAESIKKQNFNYLLLSDRKLIAARAFGIAFKVDDETVSQYKKRGIDLEDASGETHHFLPAPSAFVVDKEGIIKFAYTNPDYKVRVIPEVLLKAARDAVGQK